MLVAASVARRFAAVHPPQWMAEAVELGDLSEEALGVWAHVVETLATHFEGGAGLTYWRNECRALGIEVDDQLGPRTPSQVRVGDDVDEWAKQNKRSREIFEEMRQADRRWSTALRRLVMPLAGLSRQYQDEVVMVQDARRVLTELVDAARQHQRHLTPTLVFEEEYQFNLITILKDFDRREAADLLAIALKTPEDENLLADAFDAFAKWLETLQDHTRSLTQTFE